MVIAAVRTSPEVIEQSDAIEFVLLDSLKPAKINDAVYKPISLDDPSIVALSKDIRSKGVLQPLDVTLDDVIVSGHRRRGASIVAKLKTVPIRRIHLQSTDPRFESFLVSFNQQRVKSIQETIREEVIRTSPEAAHLALLANRRTEVQASLKKVQDAKLRVLKSGTANKRSVISEAKRAMLNAAIAVIEQYKEYWPLTLRQIHYRLLSRNVLRNTRTELPYTNTQESYKDLSDLLGRARLSAEVPWESMHDPTRPRTAWAHWENAGEYIREQLDQFLASYRRNRLQSQPAYVELVVEKITVQDIAERAAGHYHVPVGVGRGYASITSLEDTASRFADSGKGHFILLIASDLDPEGEDICSTWQAHLRDEHHVENLTVIKVGVNPDQVAKYNLAPLPMKEDSSRAAGYAATHGTDVYELESFEPDVLQAIIRDAIRDVLDLRLFAQEQQKEAEDARFLIATRNQVCELLRGFRTSPDDSGTYDPDA
ncbi:Uncharacterized protein OS=Planctomyces maris DSM 8797 GN=PM8797T_17002 PE=4 SV=1: ParBc [Gemmata massiliana]|uniref:ParB-like N-terminal domain-containing protein n=1 Tax=Gemmata massiliana TaxID=1210884 RepID=A0A6P2CYZ7_9BACT|nr:ParB N-terminal domain-containing protein [Gemmata massiliana]VTR94109.1 Uncharacterized protein OS=Planctomyces maris DSM 8797 GN=PM8797T_17002 PE=4 SV=1: ParBc [Gemmata massiliana]